MLVHKQPDDIWRIDYQLADDEDEAEALQEANVRASVAAVLADLGETGPWDLEWWSVYSANTLLLDDYRHGRTFFVGDSAHIVPIFGVRGLNNGLADGQNIGWKLGHADWPRRRRPARQLFARAARRDARRLRQRPKSARFMTPPTRGWTLMRDAALSLALDHPFAGGLRTRVR